MILKKTLVITGLIIGLLVILSYKYKNNDFVSVKNLSKATPVKVKSNFINGVVTSPRNGSENVKLTMKVIVAFNRKSNLLDDRESIFTLTGKDVIAGKVVYNGYVATFNPDEALEPNTLYTATISTRMKNNTAGPVPDVYKWTFRTEKLTKEYPEVLISRLARPLSSNAD
jgi:Bacterial Ig-like domain